MTSGSYAGTEQQRLAEALRILDTHATCPVDGRCVACGVPGPCPGGQPRW
jgi:hypothetical protein